MNALRKIAFSVLLALPFVASPAQAGLFGVWGGHSNDTGGIIPWWPGIDYRYVAAAECWRWNKIAIITSVGRAYGDYIGFSCLFPRGYDPRKYYYYTYYR